MEEALGNGIRRLLAARRPILLAPALLVGAAWAGTVALGDRHAPLLAAASAACAIAAVAAPRFSGPILAASLGCAGAGASVLARPEPEGALAQALQATDGLYRVRGTVLSTPVPTRAGEASFDLRVEALRGGPDAAPARGGLRVACDGTRLLRGDRIEALGRLRMPRPPTNPGERTAAGMLAERGIHGYFVARGDTLSVFAEPGGLSPLRAVDRLRLHLLGTLRERIATRHQPLATSLLLGFRETSDAPLLDLHARTGVLHYLAVSGVHAILVAGAVLAGARALRLPRKPEGALLLLALFAYGGITGFGAPVVRACLLLAVMRGAPLCRRVPDMAAALALSAGLGAWVDPPAVLGASYQLSHAAALGISLFARPIEKRLGGGRAEPGDPLPEGRMSRLLGRTIARARTAAAISLAAWLATTPISFHYFGNLAPWSAPATAALAPVVSFLLLAGYGALLLPGAVGAAAGGAFDVAATVEEAFLSLVDRLPGTPWTPLGIGGLEVAVGCAALLALLLPIKRRRLGFALRGVLLAASVFAWIPRGEERPLTLAVLDVGHGTAAAIVTPRGRAILFDAGSSDRREPGARILIPYLRRSRLRAVEAVVVSHADADHWNALPHLLETCPPRLLVARRGGLPRAVRYRNPATRVVEVSSGSVRFERDGARFTVLAPEVSEPATENDRSLALLVETAGRTILLCGDPEEKGLLALRAALAGSSPDILLAPHHGLPGEGLAEFLAACRPGLLLVSAGRRPGRRSPLSSFREAGLWVESTAESGAIEVEVEAGGRLRLRRFSDRRQASRRGLRGPCPGPSRSGAG